MAQPAPVVVDAAREVELALFAFADELDLPARRARRALVRLQDRLGSAKVGWETALRQLRAWTQADAAPTDP